jgi:hypothetical protein
MLFSIVGISIMMLTLWWLIHKTQFHKLLVFLLAICPFLNYVGSILICFHNGSSVCIILCILCWPLHCVVIACENLSVFIHIVMVKCKCSINDSIKNKYPFTNDVNENAECTLCNIKFCIACGGRSDVVGHVKKQNINWLFKTMLPVTA